MRVVIHKTSSEVTSRGNQLLIAQNMNPEITINGNELKGKYKIVDICLESESVTIKLYPDELKVDMIRE